MTRLSKIMPWVTLALCLLLLVGAYLAWSGWPGTNRGWYQKSYSVEADSEKDSIDRHGQFGDSFGSLNAIFTGIAAWGAIVAIMLQIWSQLQQSEQFRLAQQDQRLAAQLTAITALLNRVDRLMADTAGTTSPAQLQMRQQWMAERLGYVNQIREINNRLGFPMPPLGPAEAPGGQQGAG